MSGVTILGETAIDQKAGIASNANYYAADPWVEPFLLKFEFYRKHFTRDGRRETKSTRRGSAADNMLESRKNSVASVAPEPVVGGGRRESVESRGSA